MNLVAEASFILFLLSSDISQKERYPKQTKNDYSFFGFVLFLCCFLFFLEPFAFVRGVYFVSKEN